MIAFRSRAAGMNGASDLGGGPHESAGIGDIFLVKLDDAGQHVRIGSFGDAAHQAPAASPRGAHVGPNTPSRGFVAAFGP